jgi:hypothetical protein
MEQVRYFATYGVQLSGNLNAPIAQIISGFLSFGTLHIKTGNFEPWQWRACYITFNGSVH